MRSQHFGRAIQRQTKPELTDLAPLLSDYSWLVKAGWWRLFKRRLLAPRHSRLELTLVIEQMPHPENKITISNDHRDRNGMPIAQIEWHVRDPDFETFRVTQSAIIEYWNQSSDEPIPRPHDLAAYAV